MKGHISGPGWGSLVWLETKSPMAGGPQLVLILDTLGTLRCERVNESGALNLAFFLQLNGSAVLGPAVRLLRLPQRDARPPAAGTGCRVSGWGFVSDFEEPPPGLMEVGVRILDLRVCNSSWQGQLSPAMLCTHSGDRRRRGFCTVRFHPALASLVGKPRHTKGVRVASRLRLGTESH